MLEPDVAALRPAELQKPLAQRRDPRQSFRIILEVRHQHANAPHPLALLRACREWPRGGRAAEQRDEFPSLQLIGLHSVPASQGRRQDIELATSSQRVSERFHNL
jgi:hypothetical protein